MDRFECECEDKVAVCVSRQREALEWASSAARAGGRRGGGRLRRGCAGRPPGPAAVRTPAAPLRHARPHSAQQQCALHTQQHDDPVSAWRPAMLEDRAAREAVGERS
ncbi:hypothetical protein JYU34_003477 [Plutella xylostella]|uniref:Uncharacterized protein n=1 Tax=Plutella xylostella TaxID=51655 RepID=A0ABQ7R049_PLUXY|nr:hypothetical protein JYU34_003477 [Plutella xylostella]